MTRIPNLSQVALSFFRYSLGGTDIAPVTLHCFYDHEGSFIRHANVLEKLVFDKIACTVHSAARILQSVTDICSSTRTGPSRRGWELDTLQLKDDLPSRCPPDLFRAFRRRMTIRSGSLRGDSESVCTQLRTRRFPNDQTRPSFAKSPRRDRSQFFGELQDGFIRKRAGCEPRT